MKIIPIQMTMSDDDNTENIPLIDAVTKRLNECINEFDNIRVINITRESWHTKSRDPKISANIEVIRLTAFCEVL